MLVLCHVDPHREPSDDSGVYPVYLICPLSFRAVRCHLSNKCCCQLEEEFGKERFLWVSQLIFNVTAVDTVSHCHVSQLRQRCLFTSVPGWKYTVNNYTL